MQNRLGLVGPVEVPGPVLEPGAEPLAEVDEIILLFLVDHSSASRSLIKLDLTLPKHKVSICEDELLRLDAFKFLLLLLFSFLFAQYFLSQ